MTAARLAAGFLRMEPPLLYKDVGQFPLHLAREVGWSSELVYWMDREHEVLVPTDYARWVRRVRVSLSPSRARHTVGFLDYVRRHARNIDVLLVYHLTSESLLNLTLYKALNPRGVAVLKLDMDHRGLVAFQPTSLLTKRGALMRLFQATPLDLLLIESEGLYQQLQPHAARMGHELRLLPLGVDCDPPLDVEAALSAKENCLLMAGRLGTEQKNAEHLLEALERLPSATLGDWQFWFIGTRTEGFDARLADLRRRRPDLASRLVIRDYVASREELASIYRRARVFCLTSRWESFGIVLAEAAYAGCYLVSTDVGAAPELTDFGRHGQLVPVGDVGQLTRTLERVLSGAVATEPSARWAHHNVRDHYGWPHVARRFAAMVEERRAQRGEQVIGASRGRR